MFYKQTIYLATAKIVFPFLPFLLKDVALWEAIEDAYKEELQEKSGARGGDF
jgi:hypothetical protein